MDGETVKAPWHLWVVGVLALIWYVLGAFVIQRAQLGLSPEMPADEVAYYAAQPLWFKVVTGVSTYGSVLASILLLARKRAASLLFAIALVTIAITDVFDLANGTSRAYANNAAAVVTGIIALIALLMVVYSRAMVRRGVLR